LLSWKTRGKVAENNFTRLMAGMPGRTEVDCLEQKNWFAHAESWPLGWIAIGAFG
jgi:hypothetical protein